MKYQVGDLLKYSCPVNGKAICIIVGETKVGKRLVDGYRVHWIIENKNIRNEPACVLWTTMILDSDFERVS